MNAAWRWVRGVGALTLAGYAACGGQRLDMLGELNHGGAAGLGGSDHAGTNTTRGGLTGAGRPGGGEPNGGGNSSVAGTQTGGAGAISEGGEAGAAGASLQPALNYQVTGSWPTRPVALKTQHGKLSYTKITIHTRFLAESCAIADYNNDGLPDVSSGRRWYEQLPSVNGQISFAEHIFRGGHDDLPRTGDNSEIATGFSDDQADYALDMDGDGYMDIVDVSPPDIPEDQNPSPAPAPQHSSSAYWYRNPGPLVGAGLLWIPHLMHADVRGEQHGIGDLDGDGKPEIFGACRDCTPMETRGYYQGDWQNPTAPWTYHAVTQHYTFPFGDLGHLHGAGFGDVNGDGKADLLERAGAWIDALAPQANVLECPGAGCGFIKQNFYDGLLDNSGVKGGSHMYATDLDGDGDADVVAANWAHGEGLAWYEQTRPGVFTKHLFMGGINQAAEYGAGFSEPHALEVVDMDGDGVPDVITGKTHFALPLSQGDADPMGAPVLYVFKTRRNTPDQFGSPITLEPLLIDNEVGIGFQLGIGHINTDGILDICDANKLGLYVFLGQ